jgi:type VI secretion system protein ImpL
MNESKPPAPIGEVVAAVRALHDQLAETSAAPSPGEAAFNAAKTRMSGGGDAARKLTLLAPSEPPPVSTWLREIAAQSWDISLGAAKGNLENNLQQRVTQVCQRGLGNRFPFSAGATTEVAMQDFNDYFRPDGVEQSFVKEFLSGFVDTQTWRTRAVDGQGVGISGDTVAQLRRAQQIRTAFFAANPAAASVKFSLKPVKLDSAVRRFELDMGDGQQPIVYTHGPKIPVSINWQGGSMQRIRVVFEDLNDQVHRKEYEGDWALFRLLSDARISPAAGGGYELNINVDGRIATYQLIPASSVNPFSLDVLTGYRCPQRL